MKVELVRWEDDEFIIEIDGEPIGPTLTLETGRVVSEWLQTNSKKLMLVETTHNLTCANSEGKE